MKLTPFLTIPVFIALSGCSMDTLVEKGVDQLYPDAQRYVFYGAASETKLKYACEKGASKAATDKRAKAAHGFFDRSLAVFGRKQAEEMFARIEKGERAMKIAVQNQRQSKAWANAMQEKMMQTYQCVSYGMIEDT